MSLLGNAYNGVIVRGAFFPQGTYGKHYCDLEIMTILAESGPLQATSSIRLNFQVFQDLFVQGPIDTYWGPGSDSNMHHQELVRLLNEWNRRSQLFPLDDQPVVVLPSHGETTGATPELHFDYLLMLGALRVTLQRLAFGAPKDRKELYETLSKRFGGMVSAARERNILLTGTPSLF